LLAEKGLNFIPFSSERSPETVAYIIDVGGEQSIVYRIGPQPKSDNEENFL
jgi:hypothetical protein